MRVFYIILHRKTSKRIVIQVYRKDWFAQNVGFINNYYPWKRKQPDYILLMPCGRGLFS